MTQAAAPLSEAFSSYIDQHAFNQNEVLRIYDVNLKKGKVVFKLELTPSYQSHFALVRGIIEFRRGNAFTVEYYRHANRFVVSAFADNVSGLKSFIQTVSDLLKAEVRFKARLREVIAFEQSYKLEAQRVYQGLF